MANDLDNIQLLLGKDRMEVNGGTPSQTTTTIYYQPIVGASSALCTVHTDITGRWVVYNSAGAFLETGYGSQGLSSALHRWGLPTKNTVMQFGGGL